MQTELICWHCGAKKIMEAEPFQFGYELIPLAKQVNMIACYDICRGRILIFCNEECAKAELTKNGWFRLRAKGVAKCPQQYI